MSVERVDSDIRTTDRAEHVGPTRPHKFERSARFARIKQSLFDEPIHLCPERALLITDYFRRHDNRKLPMPVRKARALRYLLENKSARIFPDELIVGNVGRHRKSAIIQPELAGVFVSQELFWIDRRKTTFFKISWPDRLRLALKVLPYWLGRNMIVRAFWPDVKNLARYTLEQLGSGYYLINEVAGIGHFLPNYEKIIQLGVQGYLDQMRDLRGDLYDAARIACKGVLAFADRLANEADAQAREESDPARADELREIARICSRVPRRPAKTFHEAVQSLWLSHLAVCLEGMNSAVSFGRVDQFLYPYYARDLAEGRITPERAREILLCFSAKSTEHVFLVSEQTSKFHGGFLVVQAAIVGGMDRQGLDAVNDLTYIFLDVMEESGLRDPNYQARLHKDSPPEYVRRAVDVARCGNGVPALFSDEAAIDALTRHGYPLEEAREYGVVGCVELAIPGKSFLSTDAALINLPLCLILALNQGRRLGRKKQVGPITPPPAELTDMDLIWAAFETQVDHMVKRFVADIQVIEKGNARFHPTPFSSMLVDGCLESGRDVTTGGAVYNGSGIQGVGVADVADSLAALDRVVFKKQKYSLAQVLEAVQRDFKDHEKMRAELMSAPKFGNDHEIPDAYALRVVQLFHKSLSRFANTRGGPYVPGFYSSTSHVAFGLKTGALPSGRKAKMPLAASMGPCNGSDRLGPTALLNSVARVDSGLAPNGYALNLRFDPSSLAGDRGLDTLRALVQGFFQSGGMEMQFNVISPEVLQEARDKPGTHPGLVVRVAGYCAYFDDLPIEVKDEVIARTRLKI